MHSHRLADTKTEPELSQTSQIAVARYNAGTANTHTESCPRHAQLNMYITADTQTEPVSKAQSKCINTCT